MKHAYLVLAHKCNRTFNTLLHLLDHEQNDIFVHMDQKNKDFDPGSIILEKSKVYYPDKRIKVNWGGYSQIKAELLLLAKAYSIGGYGYYHLLSGEDLPIKKTKEILDFWDKNNGKEFVAFDKKEFIDHDRVDYYYFFQDKIGRERHYVLRKLDQIGVYLQKRFGLRRNSDIRFQKGANWFSISNSLAGYVLSMEGWIQETFQYTLCCDEVFLQTIVINSAFKDRLYHGGFDNDYRAIMRLVDWQRGQPYTFREEDFQELASSDKLFARKFQADVDERIIKRVEEYLQ